jgi:two-component system, OmpR family, phosphate regulon sensor histidine kinase PhoR
MINTENVPPEPRRKGIPRLRWLFAGGLVQNTVLLSILLVIATSSAVGITLVRAVAQQVESFADRRLAESAGLFQASLQDTSEDLRAVSSLLTVDPGVIGALQQGDGTGAYARMGLALRVRAVDEVVLFDVRGESLAHLSDDPQVSAPPNPTGAPGFQLALAGRESTGIQLGLDGIIRLEVYVPVWSVGDHPPIGVARLASFLTERDADRFKQRTGLEASLFFGQARVITTLRQADGTPLGGFDLQPQVQRAVLGDGRPLFASRDLPAGRVRAYYVPLQGVDGSRAGVLAVGIPDAIVQETVLGALRPVGPLTLTFTISGAALAYLIARRIRAPALTLLAAASRLRQGDLITPVSPVQEAEFAPLAEQLERARVSLLRQMHHAATEDQRERAIFAVLREPIITTTPTGRITNFNLAAASLLGHLGRVYGRPIGQIFQFLQGEPHVTAPGECSWQGRLADATGRLIDVEVSRTALEEGQRPAAHVYVIHDVSRYTELNRLREQLLYNVAHELRAPLAVLDNALDIIAAEYGDLSADELDQLTHSARRTSKRLRTLMEDLLSAGSIQSGRFQVRLVPVDVAEIVSEALEFVGGALDARRQRVELDLQLDGQRVLADARYARQVLSNLLSNAAKYSSEGDVIRLGATPVDGHVRLTVEDHGPGIPSDQQAGLFERYYRSRPQAEEPGIGLGLAIAKGIVEAHGGTIGIDSDAGKGTRVWFTLPVAPVREEG